MPVRLVLASASPRRRELLAQAGYTFAVEATDVDESRLVGEEAGDYVRRLAEEKARVVLGRHLPAEDASPRSVGCGHLCGLRWGDSGEAGGCGGCDADVANALGAGASGVDGSCRGDARWDGECGGIDWRFCFAERFPEAELTVYCATGEPMDKAGAYGIQGYAARWIPRIDGCYFNVMGVADCADGMRLIEEVTND